MIRSITRIAPRFSGKEEVVVVPLFKEERRLKGAPKKLDVLCRSAISSARTAGHFDGDAGKTLLLALHLPTAPAYVLLLGLGKKKDIDAERMAAAAGTASNCLGEHGFKTVHLLLTDDENDPRSGNLFESFLKGFQFAQYRFSLGTKKRGNKAVRKLVIMTETSKSIANATRRARVVAQHAAIVRDLVNTPANILTPDRLAQETKELAREHGVTCRVMGVRDLERIKMGAILAVAKGSREEPRFIAVHYNKGQSKLPKVCLVGKAVTFDSGGISIKPWLNMHEMKGDMAGGAVVINTVCAAARLKLPVEVIGLVPSVENMPGGTAFRPGDVITSYAGKTIEVLSTDAEGRLILADALAYAGEFDPDVIVDFATLTGAVVIALGTRIAGAIGNDQAQMDRLIAAGRSVGERVWQLPLDDKFSNAVNGDISDYKNYSGREGSSITAAALLGKFVGKTPWIHVDIAGTFWSNGGGASYHGKGATGYGVDLALSFLESVARDSA